MAGQYPILAKLFYRFKPNERAALERLAEKYAGGNMSRLILDALQRAYPTL